MIAFARGGWGWFLIGAVLLVPLFWLWQSSKGMNSNRLSALPAKAPPSAFAGAANPANLAPAGSSSQAGSAPPSALPTTAGAKIPLALPISTAAAAEKSGPSGQKSPALSAGIGASPSGQKAGALSVAGPTPNTLKEDLPGFSPKVDRDPTLSPPDIVRLQTPRTKAVKAVKGPGPIEERIDLTGIISTPRGINAIVNNERVRKNDEVLGARIVRITQSCVDFEYHRKTFKKCIQ